MHFEALSRYRATKTRPETKGSLRPWQTRTHCCGHIAVNFFFLKLEKSAMRF